jgi:deazaflavin-dependent oxidoreductase (nitroreductase family)
MMSLASFKKALEGKDEVEITVTGRRSGRSITNPVWFVQKADKLYLLPGFGSDSDWYRNVLKTPTVRLGVDGNDVRATAKPLTEPGQVRDMVDKFGAKYGAGQIQQYYPKLDAAIEIPLK